MRSTDVHSWPALANAPAAAWPAAHAGSTPSSTISGSLPPSSSSALRRSPAHAAASSRPVAIEPVWMTRSTPGWAASGRPARPGGLGGARRADGAVGGGRVAGGDRADLRAGGRVEDGDRLAGRGRRLRGGGRCGHAARLPPGPPPLTPLPYQA